jgi:SRSO17 transposase
MIALEIIQEALSDGVAPAPVLADAVYGDNADFLAGLKGLGLEFFLQVDAGKHKGWSFEVPREVKWVRRHPKPEAPHSRTLREVIDLRQSRRLGECEPLKAAFVSFV